MTSESRTGFRGWPGKPREQVKLGICRDYDPVTMISSVHISLDESVSREFALGGDEQPGIRGIL